MHYSLLCYMLVLMTRKGM